MSMADSIKDLLGEKNFSEPREVTIIKRFLKENFDASCQVSLQLRTITIGVAGASLAGALRMRLHELRTLCKTDKRLLIRII